ncbi:MAG: DNA polymerase III subunit alpha [Psychroserpens sp.]|uniref:DNA polymerase III subunit alpha n=1 Tax=Psychroserpens sp. TaxID=2020870 RepID=UPI003C7642CE
MYTNCHTYYSLRYGTFSEVELIALAKQHGIDCLALTDINSTSACLNFIKECQEEGLKPVVGIDVRNGITQEFVLLAKNNNGYQEINVFLSEHLHEKKAFPVKAPVFKNCFIIYSYEKVLELELTEFNGDEFIGVSIKDASRLKFSKYKSYHEKLVIQQQVTFRSKKDFNAHRLLRAIDLNTLLSKLPSKEESHLDNRMFPKNELLEHYTEFETILSNTTNILNKCKVHFDFNDNRSNQNQMIYLESKEQDFNYLKQLCQERISNRYSVITKVITDRIEKELNAIEKMDFVSYFLINNDILEYARSRNYPYIGRGSGSNSIVAYILGITNVDPIELDLYFERFINVFRSSPPDFDIDFSWKDRDDITNYIFERFSNTALMGTYVTFQYRAVIRELGKVFGLPKEEIDNFLNGYRSKRNEANSEYIRLITVYAKLIHGFPNYLSVHSGGILITQKPVAYYTSTFLPPKGFPTVQFDMNIAEEVGIFKFDILAQRGLSKIKDCIELVKENQPNTDIEDIEHTEIFKNDPNINGLLKTGDCMGVFYVESPAMRTLMTKLRTDNYLNLVAASSIIRPGVSNGGMKNEFILRHRIPEKRKEAHPIMLKILHETYGVMVYQEDVLKVAHEFAGLSLSESDVLRRGMRGKVKSKSEFEAIEIKFKLKCKEKGYTQALTEEVWLQIKAFAGYAFAKGHSASYAVESYQSLYLKKYFPLEFMTAVLNNGGGFYNIETYVHEIAKCGGKAQVPCINNSNFENKIIGKTVFLGLGMIKGLELRTAQKILNERQLYGDFKNFDDFLNRVFIGLEQTILLLRINAFRFTGIDKHMLLWEVHIKFNHKQKSESVPQLFNTTSKTFKIPDIRTNHVIEAYDQIELLGFPLGSYFQLLDEPIDDFIKVKDLRQFIGRRISIYGKLVTAKGTPTADKRLMHFGTFLDSDGDVFDTVHFPEISKKYSIKSNGIYLIKGKVVDDLGSLSIIAEYVERQPMRLDPRYNEKSHKLVT